MASINKRRGILKHRLWILFAGILLLSVALAAVFFPKKVKEADTVKVNYTLVLDDGSVYYTTTVTEPIHVNLGQGTLISSFEEALIGMRVGETKIVTIPAEKAYGPYRDDLVQLVDRSQLPDGVLPEIGLQFDAELLDGSPTKAVITEITDTTVTLDANHPLAGQNLTFEINLMFIEESAAPADRTKLIIGGTLLAVGAGVAGFAFFNTRNRRKFRLVRWPGLTRRIAPTGYRRR